MPTFGRLGRHSNRSQHAIPDTPVSSAGSGGNGAGTSGGSGAAIVGDAGAGPPPGTAISIGDSPTDGPPPSALSQLSPPADGDRFVTDGASHPPALLSSLSSSSSSHAQQQQQQQQQHQQQQQQQQQPPAPPPHGLFHSASVGGSASPLQNSQNIGGGSPIFDGRPQPPIDFADGPPSRSQSQRYGGSIHHQPQLLHRHQQHQQHQQQQQQQQDIYGIASSSVDDLNTTTVFQPPPTAAAPPEKRSTRKLIKGIFSGSGRGGHDNNQQQQQQQQAQQQAQQLAQQQAQQQAATKLQQGHGQHSSYENIGGLARRPSKRVSNPPNLKTSVSQPQAQSSADRDWYAQQQQQQSSPLHDVGEVDEYYHPARESTQDIQQHDSRLSLRNSIRQVAGEVEPSPYDDVAYNPSSHPPPPHYHQYQQHQQPPLSQQHQQSHQQPPQSQQQQQQQQQQPHLQLRIQDQQSQYNNQNEQVVYEVQSPVDHQHQQQQLAYPAAIPQQQDQYHQQVGEPPVHPGQTHLGARSQQQNPETISQLSHESPITDPDQRHTPQQSAQTSPAVQHQANPIQEAALTPKPTAIQQSVMAPPGGAQPSSRRAQEAEKALRGQVEPPQGPPPGYRQNNSSMSALSPLPPASQSGSQTAAYRGERPPQFDGAGGDQGRNSPQPSNPDRDAEGEKAFKELLTKYKNVKRLYFDGKSQIEQLTSQVEHLQNAVANQRMSQSRTALDDNEYTTRFNRLNGAINNLSFNIRKDWRALPPWLEGYVSADVLKTGKQEMTAAGRAIISGWMVEEIFNKSFYPGLDAQLSAQLKEIELSIRGNAYTMHSQEELDALTTKIVNWRMATLDGLQKKLNAAEMSDNRAMLTSKATTNLTAYLYQYLSNPPPPGVEGSTSMIVELAVGIAANLPLESRDVAIMYPMPGDTVQPHLMEFEKAGLPALEAHKGDGDSDGEDVADKEKSGKNRGDKTKTAAAPDSIKVRFAGFPALEVRGRQVLMKAPVWTIQNQK